MRPQRVEPQSLDEAGLAARLRDVEAVTGLGQFALESADLEALFDEAVRVVREILDVESVALFELTADHRLLLRAGVGWADEPAGRVTLDAADPVQEEYPPASGEPVLVQDLAGEDRLVVGEPGRAHGVRSGVSRPIVTHDGPFGAIAAYSRKPRALGYPDLWFLGAVANVLAAAIDRWRAESHVARLQQETEAILQSTWEGICGIARDGTITFANEAAARLLGRPAGSLVGASAVEIFWPENPRAALQSLCDGASRHERDATVTRPDGGTFVASCVCTPVLEGGEVVGGVLTFTDTTHQRRREQALRAAEARFRLTFNNAPIGMALVGPDGRWQRINHTLSELVGYSEQELAGESVWRIIHPEDRAVGKQNMRRLLRGEAQAYRSERRYLHADGTVVWALADVSLVRDEAGAPMHFIVQVQDISEHKEVEARLTYQALHDPLTGLGNRTLLLDRLTHALARQRRDDSLVALLFLDLDRFKVVNDTYGHEAGDRLLVQVGYRLRGALRPGDTAARLGGDEFVVLCEDIPDRAAGAAVAERVERELARPFTLSSVDLTVSASIGVVFAHGVADDAEALLRDADAAMYRAKNLGRARVEVFGERQREQTLGRLRIERDLRHALDRDQLAVVYQPILELRGGQLVAVEALVRWQHPTLGLLLPDAFLGVAEDSGLIVPIGLWVLEQACRQAVLWNAARPPQAAVSVSVNLSARQLNRPDAPGRIADILSSTALPSSRLQLEITESALLETAATTPAELAALDELGVSMGIDDFGTGYSSMVYLKRFPLDFLKVDRSFVDGLGRNREDSAIVDAIIALGRALGLVTVAEGAETAEQEERLRRLGCDRVQGFHICRPRAAAELTDLLPVGGAGQSDVGLSDLRVGTPRSP